MATWAAAQCGILAEGAEGSGGQKVLLSLVVIEKYFQEFAHVAEAERSHSKLKLIRSYLRSTMSQECLKGLAVISVNHALAEQMSYDNVIDTFAAMKARKIMFIGLDTSFVFCVCCVAFLFYVLLFILL